MPWFGWLFLLVVVAGGVWMVARAQKPGRGSGWGGGGTPPEAPRRDDTVDPPGGPRQT